MKKIFSLILFLFPGLLMAQLITPEKFAITGHAGKLNPPAQVYLLYQYGATKVLDSTTLANGDFAFTGEVLNPVNAYLVMDPKGVGFAKLSQSADAFNFFLDKGTMTVTSTDSIAKATITGSAINDENKSITIQLKPIQEAAKELNAEVNAAPPAKQNSTEFRSQMQARAKVLQDRQQSVLQTFVVTHPASYLSLMVLSSLGQQSKNPEEVESLFNALSPALQNSEAGKLLQSSINRTKSIAVGSIAPDFIQNDVNGLPVKLSSFRGKYVLVDFWASWCGPCRQESPNLVRAYNKYKTKNFTILGVSLDRPNGKDDWQKAIINDKLAWTQVSDLKFWSNSAALLYYVGEIPSNFLLDPDGKIIAKNLRGTDLDDKLVEIFGKI